MPITAKQSRASRWSAFNTVVKRLRGAFQKICRGYHRFVLTWHLRQLDRDHAEICRGYHRFVLIWHLSQLDRDHAEIWASVKHERLYLETMERSVRTMLKENNQRCYSLQRRLMDLDMEDL